MKKFCPLASVHAHTYKGCWHWHDGVVWSYRYAYYIGNELMPTYVELTQDATLPPEMKIINVHITYIHVHTCTYPLNVPIC